MVNDGAGRVRGPRPGHVPDSPVPREAFDG